MEVEVVVVVWCVGGLEVRSGGCGRATALRAPDCEMRGDARRCEEVRGGARRCEEM